MAMGGLRNSPAVSSSQLWGIWQWLRSKELGLRRCWSIFPLTRVPFWCRLFEPYPYRFAMNHSIPNDCARNHSARKLDIILSKRLDPDLTCSQSSQTVVFAGGRGKQHSSNLLHQRLTYAKTSAIKRCTTASINRALYQPTAFPYPPPKKKWLDALWWSF